MAALETSPTHEKENVKTLRDGSYLEVGGDVTESTEDLVQAAEQAAEAPCSPWTKTMFRLYGCLLITYFCGCLNGYDGSLMGGLNAMQSYQDTFNT